VGPRHSLACAVQTPRLQFFYFVFLGETPKEQNLSGSLLFDLRV
jgi:hypothetical protein